ncbi:MAG: sensor histidine kinase [Chitinophagaceae bacterium]|nr:MAG: sensor histidine kinase [Chitinophagaceae bacterium]
MYRCLLSLLLSLACLSAYADPDARYRDSLKTRLDSTRFDTIRMRCLIKLGVYYEGENPKTAEGYLLRAYRLKLPNTLSDPSYRSIAAIYLGKVYASLGDTARSYHWCMKALQHVGGSSDPSARFQVWDYLSTWYLGRDRYDSALYFSQKVTDLWEGLNDPGQAAAGYFGTGNIFGKMRQFSKAISYIRKSMTMAGIDERSNSPYLIPILQSLAEFQAELGRYDSSLYFAKKLYPIALEQTYYDGVIESLALQSAALTRLGRGAEAAMAAREGYALAQSNQHTGKMQMLCGAIAVAFAAEKRGDSARFYASKAEAAFKASASSNEDRVNLYRMWSDVYASLGDWQQAHRFKAEELAAFTAFRSEQVSAVTAHNEVVYETGKKEKTISELSAENRARRTIQWLTAAGLVLALLAAGFAFASFRNKQKAANLLAQSNREKDVFLKEIHHRVKNNLQIISSLLYMQFRDQKDEAMIAKLKQAQERIKSMALVHNKLYEAPDVVHVYLREYIEDLASGILAANVPPGKQVHLDVEADRSLQLSLDTSISLGLMLNEVITNACKYAFRNEQAGNIHIRLIRVHEGYQLEVRDDGSGLPEGYGDKGTLGVRLVKNLARQLHGSVTFANENGAVVTIRFQNESKAA